MSPRRGRKELPLPLASPGEPPPAEGAILRHLAQTLSIPRTFRRFPSLKPQDLQAILLRCAARAEKPQSLEESPPVRREPELFIHADGASRGNPGEAGAGVVILDGRGRTVRELKRFLGLATNNFAEYQALILALEEALELGAGSVRVHLDSELAVRQIGGEYQVRNAGLKPVHRRVLELLEKFARAEVVHVPREKNRRADQLANEAIDEKDSTRE